MHPKSCSGGVKCILQYVMVVAVLIICILQTIVPHRYPTALLNVTQLVWHASSLTHSVEGLARNRIPELNHM